MNEEFDNFPVWKFVLFGMGVVISTTLTLTTWLFTRVMENGDRLIAIESSRCTYEHCSANSNTVANIKDRVEKDHTQNAITRNRSISNTQRISILERESKLIDHLNRADKK